MIDGIAVLDNVNVSNFNPVPWLVVFVGFLAAFIIIYIKLDEFDNMEHTIGLFCMICTLLLILFVSDILFSKVDAIQCTIDDNVSINEVYDKYDVIDKQGEIWTLREKAEK